MTGAKRSENRWLWYSSKTPKCVPLDRDAYPSTTYDGMPVPWPKWACKAPDGGIHASSSVGQIDVHVSATPRDRDEVTWTCDFQIRVVSRQWLAEIEDLVDGRKVCVGRLYLRGKELKDWATLHEVNSPALFASEGRAKTCPICNHHYTTLHGSVSFLDRAVADRPLILAGNGIFISEAEVARRNLRTPSGVFKPRVIRFTGPDT
ncbi:hypothetical protein [Phenylobacterium sp.]|uniref:hypothetical protein n=1 Tax=Phenylobacterium sp. TaxID=1871053 RepID=UPI0025CE1A88|nr:hypothetical protein [Phenylobacterium sp.]